MDNENLNNEIGTPGQDEDIILPEGYNDENIFAAPEGDDENIFGKEDTIEGFGDEGKGEEDPAPEEEQEKPEPEKEDGVGAGSEKDSAPAAEEAVSLFKIKDGDQDVELKETDISDLYRFKKEHAGDSGRLQELQAGMAEAEAMAKRLGFADFKDMLAKAQDSYRDAEIKRLTEDPDHPVHPEVAKAIVESKMRENAAKAAAPQQEQKANDGATAPATQRDFHKEMADLLAERPQLRSELSQGGRLPQEVVSKAAGSGMTLRAAYAEYEAEKAKQDAKKAKQEIIILKQNADAKAKAPVKGTAGSGAVDAKVKDPFLEGFLSDD